MLPPSLKKFRSILFVCAALWLSDAGSVSAGDSYKWSVEYLIDNSRTIFGRPQKVSPRANRALAISPNYKYLYAGYHHSFNNAGEVRRIRVGVADYDRATEAVLPGYLSKAVATDDKGRVYICDFACIVVYDAELEHRQLRIPTFVCEGIATAREGSQLVLYGSDREAGTLNRWVLQEAEGLVTAATPSGFDGSGVLKLPGATDLRGVEMDMHGNVWVADHRGGKVFRIGADGNAVKSVEVAHAGDIAIDGQRVFVSRATDGVIAVLDLEMNVLGNLGVPWEELALSPYGNNRVGAVTGIVAVPGKGFFVTNESGQTLRQRSTYGRIDDHSDFIGGKMFRDIFQDDNDPILRATEVETLP